MKAEKSRNFNTGSILENMKAKIPPENDNIKYTNNDSRFFFFSDALFFFYYWASDDESPVPWRFFKEREYF